MSEFTSESPSTTGGKSSVSSTNSRRTRIRMTMQRDLYITLSWNGPSMIYKVSLQMPDAESIARTKFMLSLTPSDLLKMLQKSQRASMSLPDGSVWDAAGSVRRLFDAVNGKEKKRRTS
eukprot:gnl/TRDRNA2_/TRDRNA2_163297_c0_seq2.p2 gnl/TRDRNA2_/TRDRNA2_163297_c0~~gnl/TRDRNA2_/TRDRNA2_163297_c0_seq2.p2  ORF type:complete len:119 (-),score=18.09 gnl/TRDRNA2_/TRDRNA2_163297_c0_seq2:375-731(-)